MTNLEITIDISLVSKLITSQSPQWAHLSIRPVAYSGWDNRTFHLGNQMLVRMPSGPDYATKVAKEQEWLLKLAPLLLLPIPTPLAMGMPAEDYPWHWSIYRWIA
jgi:aminoglycoside phosphotransferase (APT) family kinase protein